MIPHVGLNNKKSNTGVITRIIMTISAMLIILILIGIAYILSHPEVIGGFLGKIYNGFNTKI